jgi:hypothetical protein
MLIITGVQSSQITGKSVSVNKKSYDEDLGIEFVN